VGLEKQCEWKRGSEILPSKIMATVERAPSDGAEPTMRPPLMRNFRDIRPLVIGVAEMACGSKESNPPFPFPPRGKPGRGAFPPRRKHVACQQKALARIDAAGSPHKRAAAPLCIPR
jgi:hypothetical protein